MKRLHENSARFVKVTAALCAVVFLSSCAVFYPASPHRRPAGYRAPELTSYYDYPKTAHAPVVIEREEKKKYVRTRMEMPLELSGTLEIKNLEGLKKEVEDLEKANNRKKADDLRLRFTNRFDYYVPKNLKPGEKRPFILISPILGGNMVVDRFAAYYADKGFVAAIVHRKKPYLSEKPDDLSGIEDYMRTSVIRLRQVLDWAVEQPEVDADRIGSFGVSYGAVLHSILAAVEPRIRFSVLAMPGGNLAELIMVCPEKPIKKLVKQARSELGWPDRKIYSELKEHIQSDPIYFAPYIDAGRVRFYLALFDGVVGANRSWKLWNAMGRPSLRVLPFGHYGGILVFPLLEWQSYRAFRKHFG